MPKIQAEPGAWVNDMPDGIPKPQPPEPLSEDKLSAHEIRELVAYEGLGFCIHSYIFPQRIADAELSQLWVKAKKSLQAVVDYLEGLPAEDPSKREKTKLRYNKSSSKKPKTNLKPVNIGREL